MKHEVYGVWDAAKLLLGTFHDIHEAIENAFKA